MQTNGTVYVRHAEELVRLFHDLFHTTLLRLFQCENVGVFGINIGDFVSIIGLIPVAYFSDHRIHGALLGLSKDGIICAGALSEIDVVTRA